MRLARRLLRRKIHSLTKLRKKRRAAIVCQPSLGASLRKGWFRMIGTQVSPESCVWIQRNASGQLGLGKLRSGVELRAKQAAPESERNEVSRHTPCDPRAPVER